MAQAKTDVEVLKEFKTKMALWANKPASAEMKQAVAAAGQPVVRHFTLNDHTVADAIACMRPILRDLGIKA